jgi:L-seryl-tRNA(Ser) seleniumtransferase
MDGPNAAKLRALPQVQVLLETPEAAALLARHGRPGVLAALRGSLDEARGALLGSGVADCTAKALLDQAARALEAAPRLRRVINATGIVLHTNLGRAPLAAAAIAAVTEAASYCTLEYDLVAGARGSRTRAIEPLIRDLTGAEAAVAVNNNAAAMLLALTALAAGGEVIVSRGELIEIGGGFRIPDIIAQGGARLVEVGTTNKTRLADYRGAITPATRALLSVHRGNFAMVGFTDSVARPDLVGLARAHGLTMIEDLGHGDLAGVLGQDSVADAIRAGVDVVAFSADKLLGGPQAGILAGRTAAIAPIACHPLMRALRLDKLTLAALEATLRLHARGAHDAIPALRMLGQSAATLRGRAARLAALIGPAAEVVAAEGQAGGGTLPAQPIASAAVALRVAAPSALAARLRAGTPPVIGRVSAGLLRLDMLSVADDDVAELAACVRVALSA